MIFPALLRRLHELTEIDYERIGLRGNPAYSELRRGPELHVHVKRGKLEDELIDLIEGFLSGEEVKHAYLFSREGGAGKSHTQNVLRRYCEERDIPFIDMLHEDIGSDLRGSIPYLLGLIEAERVIIFLECDFPNRVYRELVELPRCLIIGSGHNPWEELRGVIDLFKVYDLERDYPMTSEQLYELLRLTMEELRIGENEVISDGLLRAIAERTRLPGEALNLLGILLAIKAWKAKEGEDYELTEWDVEIWSQRGMRFIG